MTAHDATGLRESRCELAATGVDDPLTGCTKCGAKPDYMKPDYAAVLDYEYKCQEGRKP